jgi:hypothetical protein
MYTMVKEMSNHIHRVNECLVSKPIRNEIKIYWSVHPLTYEQDIFILDKHDKLIFQADLPLFVPLLEHVPSEMLQLPEFAHVFTAVCLVIGVFHAHGELIFNRQCAVGADSCLVYCSSAILSLRALQFCGTLRVCECIRCVCVYNCNMHMYMCLYELC